MYDIRDQLKRFDFNNDGKVSIEDVHAVIDEHLQTIDPLRIGAFAFTAGIVVTIIATLFLR